MGSVTAMNQADTRWQYSDSSEAYVNLFKSYCINDNKRAFQHLGHVSRRANVSSRSHLEIWTSRLSLVSAGEANVSVLSRSQKANVSVSAIDISCPSLPVPKVSVNLSLKIALTPMR